MKLLIDLGNSRIKWATWTGDKLRPGQALDHVEKDNVDFSPLWKNLQKPDEIWVASVASPELETSLTQSLLERYDVSPRYVRSSAGVGGVHNAYAIPERLGVDRFLGLVALHAMQPVAAVLISCGTALTLDALDGQGRHHGGLIAPSPALMRDALLDRTARIGTVERARVVEFADNTADAVESGTWLAATALVERFVTRTASRFGTPPMIVFTGGAGARLASLTGLPHRLEEHLVLRGLAVYADGERKIDG